MFLRRGEQCLAAPGATLREWIRGALPHVHRPRAADLEAHLTTLFPPVRARGFFEVRYLDTQSPRCWPVPLIVLATLLDHRDLGDRALAACAPVRRAWDRAARLGLRDARIAAAARAVIAGIGERLRQGVTANRPRWWSDSRTGTSTLPGRRPDARPEPRPGPAHGGALQGGVMTLDATTMPPDALRTHLAQELTRVRTRSAGLTTAILDDQELLAQHSRLMSPLVWDLAHVGNYEELWLLRAAAGIEPMRPEIDDLYDAFEHPRDTRPTLPLLTAAESTGYLDLVRRKVLDTLQRARFEGAGPLLDSAFVYGLVLQHEHQHDETMLATHQLRRGTPVLDLDADPSAPAATHALPAEVPVPAGTFIMGTSDDPWAYDNEKPAHEVHVPQFWIDTTPVSVAAYREFVDAGGYEDERWWTSAGWQWRCRSGKRAPAYWVADERGWARRRFGRLEALPDAEPVQHVCWFEADAYARWAGRRLPTEAEWEKAASWDEQCGAKRRFPWGDEPPGDEHANIGQRRYRPAPVGSFPAGASPCGALQMLGDVWEWTSSGFESHPGFRSFPYEEYSQVFFGGDYRVLRGGSWATDALATRTTFRNWDHPIRRQIFSGFRTARDARPDELAG